MSSKQAKGSSNPPIKSKSPCFRARDFKNEVKVGLDGKPWVSIPNKIMNYSWQPYGGTAHDKYIEKAASLGDICSINSLDDVSESPTEKKKTPKKSQKTNSTKKTVMDQTPAKKTTMDQTPAKKTTKIIAKYTKKVDKTGRVMYYNATGKRTAKKNVPEEYL